jgi:small GTP-binding protein
MNERNSLNIINLVTLGESSVGKSSIINRYTQNIFNFSFVSTIGIEFRRKTITINNNVVEIKIWNTAGQELYRSVQKQYYRNSDGILLIFDVTNMKSFNLLESWIREIKNETSRDEVVIVGNKIDLENRVVEDEDIQKFCNKNNYKFFTTSAATGENINECFEYIINEAYKNKSQKLLNNNKDNVQIITLKKLSIKRKTNCCF